MRSPSRKGFLGSTAKDRLAAVGDSANISDDWNVRPGYVDVALGLDKLCDTRPTIRCRDYWLSG